VNEANLFCCQHESGGNGTLKLECRCALPFFACLVEKPCETQSSQPVAETELRHLYFVIRVARQLLFVVGCFAIKSLMENSGIIGSWMVQSVEEQ